MKRHSTDLVSVIFGVIFLAIAGWWLLGRYVHLNVPHGGWVLAGALILIGLLGVVGSLRGDRTREPAYAQPVPAPVDTTTTFPAAAASFATADTRAEANTAETIVSDATAAHPTGTDPTARDWSPTDWTARDPAATASTPAVEEDNPAPGTSDRGY